MKKVNSGSLSHKQRNEILKKLVRFLSKPRTRDQVADKFNISGTSAGALLKFLMWSRSCQLDPKKGTYLVKP